MALSDGLVKLFMLIKTFTNDCISKFRLPDKTHKWLALQRTTSWSQEYRPLNRLEKKKSHLLEERCATIKQML